MMHIMSKRQRWILVFIVQKYNFQTFGGAVTEESPFICIASNSNSILAENAVCVCVGDRAGDVEVIYTCEAERKASQLKSSCMVRRLYTEFWCHWRRRGAGLEAADMLVQEGQ